MTNNEYWDKEEFEDLVARSLIAMYETKISKASKKVPSFIKPTDKDLLEVRKQGIYFSPGDREGWLDHIDINVDGIPATCSHAFSVTEKMQETSWVKNEYLRSCYMKKIISLPPAIHSMNRIKELYFKMLVLQPSLNGSIGVTKSYVTLDMNGNFYDTYARRYDGKLQTIASGISAAQSDNPIRTDIGWASFTMGIYQDRRYLWNVTASEGIAKATFGVYPEQIKSLFYARSLPLTDTGRKRPILHWVASHNRRIKSGIDIDIEKHLRGINEFVYQDTKFKITRPLKAE